MELWDIYHGDIPDFLKDAAQTGPMQRLKGVGMNCGCEYTAFDLFAGWQPYSRFDHSMGAALIVWHFTGDRHQAMAALLHDIATPVFSHVVDFLRGDHERQESTETGTEQRILGSRQLGEVFARHGIDPQLVTDYHRYPIADNDSPRLSADRLEYTLGNIVNFGFGTRQRVREYYGDLVSNGEELVFSTPALAVDFARDALRCGRVYVSDEDRFAMQTLADLLKDAVAAGILREESLYLQEADVIRMLQRSPLSRRWQDYRQLSRLYRGPGGTVIPAKKRYIDPCTKDGVRASALDGEFAARLTEFLEGSFAYGLWAEPCD